MATTYTWTISALDCAVSEDGLSNVVQTVHWRYAGTDENGTTAETYSSTGLEAPDSGSFIAYPDLDLATVSGWLESILDVSELQTNVDNQINEINNPVRVTLPLPTGSAE